MKNKHNLHDLLQNQTCSQYMADKVIAFAEGQLNEKEYPAIYEHLAQCNFCLYMLEDFDIVFHRSYY